LVFFFFVTKELGDADSDFGRLGYPVMSRSPRQKVSPGGGFSPLPRGFLLFPRGLSKKDSTRPEDFLALRIPSVLRLN